MLCKMSIKIQELGSELGASKGDLSVDKQDVVLTGGNGCIEIKKNFHWKNYLRFMC